MAKGIDSGSLLLLALLGGVVVFAAMKSTYKKTTTTNPQYGGQPVYTGGQYSGSSSDAANGGIYGLLYGG